MPDAREDLNRLRKALKIADICQASGISSMEAAKASEEDWGMAARGAGFSGYTPSPETQKVVIQLLLDREKAAMILRPRPALDVHGYSATQQPAQTRPEVKP